MSPTVKPTERRVRRPFFTIERLRTLVLVGGVLLVAAIGIFLAAGQWKLRRTLKDLPKRLGIDIQQQADGVNYTQSRKGKTLFKIHAARAVQMKKDGKTLLHDVKIELYGEDGKSVDTISGAEFEYDPGAGIAQAAGAVEITLSRPGVTPAIAQLRPGAPKPPVIPSQLATQVVDNEIHVKTSGLVFDQKSQIATTQQRVDFTLRQGTGSSTGATYDSAKSHLILDRDVALHVNRIGGPVTVHATHGEFERAQQLCQLTQAHADYSGGTAQTGNALIHFRDDGSILRLDGSNGVDLRTKAGSHVTAPTSTLEFDEKNHPRHGLMQGGTRLDFSQPNRQIQGSAPTARLEFNGDGELRNAHLEQGVLFNSQQSTISAKGAPWQVRRTWKSQTADIAFAPSPSDAGKKAIKLKEQGTGHSAGGTGKIEPRTIHGNGSVLITSETTGANAPGPAKLSADSVVAQLAPGSVLSTLSGTGHAIFEQQTAAGARQSSSSDQLDVRFTPTSASASQKTSKATPGSATGGSEIESIVQVGHVILDQDAPLVRVAGGNRSSDRQAPVHATAARAEYEAQTQLLHLSGSPRIQNGALDMTADRIDFANASGDAFAHGDVKASWSGQQSRTGSALPGSSLLGSGSGNNGPIHAVAAEAELHQASEEVIFRSPAASAARIWQAANSVSAPLITLNRQKQTLTAQTTSAANPVRTVLVNNSAASAQPSDKKKPTGPSIIRLRSGDLHYSEGERLALLHGGAAGRVTAESSGGSEPATVTSDNAEVRLLPPGVHTATQSSKTGSPSNNSVDRMTATGHVAVDWPGRKGTGEKLVYLSDDGTFTLTGTSEAQPRIADGTHGTVTGTALIFHSGDDSVTVEGDGGKTLTETQSPKKRKPASP
jgi:lipopolysaccharide export system protein LptA